MRTTNHSFPRALVCAASTFGILALLYSHWAAASDVTDYLIAKGQLLNQTTAGSPTALSSSGFVFQAEVGATATDSVQSVELTLPNGTNHTLAFDGTNTFAFADARNSRVTLDSAYPTGAYTFTIVTLHDGTNTPTVTIATNHFPNAPRITNWVAAQLVDATADFRLSWNQFLSATSNDFISLTVFDRMTNEVFATGTFGSTNALNGTNRFVIIPAGTLATNQSYQANLTFFRVAQRDTNSIPDATGLAGLFSETRFGISTDTNYTGLGIVTTALSNAEIGVFYSATLVITGGLPPYTVCTPGDCPLASLPPALRGLTLSSSGVLAGIPSRPWNPQRRTASSKNTPFHVVVMDQTGASVTRRLRLRTFEPVGIETPRLRNGVVSNSYRLQLKALRGEKPYLWSDASSNLPAGLTLIATNGLLTGIPTTSGTFTNITFRVTDALGGTDQRTYSLTIRE